jgi:excisionase family DNA binding protein
MASKSAEIDLNSPELDPEKKPTLTVEEVAKVLGTGRSATYEWIRQGKFGAVIRVGRTILVPTAALRRLLELDGPAIPDEPETS